MSAWVTINRKRYEQIHVVHNGDPGAGFSALITYALNGVRRAQKRGWFPVVDFSGESTPHYYDSEYGENVWEYYFEPVAGVSSGTLKDWLQTDNVTLYQIHRFSNEQVVGWHVNDPDRITTFWGPESVEDRRQWMEDKRRLGRE